MTADLSRLRWLWLVFFGILIATISGGAAVCRYDGGHSSTLAAKGGDDLISFYHGTSRAGAESIGAGGINLGAGRAKVDFGQGFYTTMDQAQASAWAAKKFGADAAVMEFRVSRSALEGMSNLNMGGATQSSLFRCFRHNRLGGRLHSYDTVSGPMLGNPGSFLRGSPGTTLGQQTSWHTQSAADMLWSGLVR
jgi:hypothetical protein